MSILPRVAGAVAPFALLALLGVGEAQAQRGVNRLEGRPREAVDLCLRRAEDIVRERERGRAGVEIEEVIRADEDGDEVEIQGYVRISDRDGDRREAWLDCKVDFDGENRVSDFDEDALVRSISYDRDRDRRGNDRRRRGEPAENARAACRETFEQQGYRISDIRDRDRNDNQVRLEMRVERNNGRRFDAVCLYNRERDEARFGELRPVSRN